MVDEIAADPWAVPGADVFGLLMGKDVVVRDISGGEWRGVLIFRDDRRLVLRSPDGHHKVVRRGKGDANLSGIEENGHEKYSLVDKLRER